MPLKGVRASELEEEVEGGGGGGGGGPVEWYGNDVNGAQAKSHKLKGQNIVDS